MRKASLVNIILESVLPSDSIDSACYLPINQILDVAQDLLDEMWFAISNDGMEPDEPSCDSQTVPSPESNPDELSYAMYNRLASW